MEYFMISTMKEAVKKSVQLESLFHFKFVQHLEKNEISDAKKMLDMIANTELFFVYHRLLQTKLDDVKRSYLEH
jgi:hypothetical protein